MEMPTTDHSIVTDSERQTEYNNEVENKNNENTTSLQQRLTWALETAKGIWALHRANIAHLDIKTDNCLMHNETIDRSVKSRESFVSKISATFSRSPSSLGTVEQPSRDTPRTHENTTTCTAYVTDFGQSRKVERNPNDERVKIKLKAGHGTMAFSAKELRPATLNTPSGSDRLRSLHATRADSMVEVDPFAVDVWAFGFVLYECVTCHPNGQREPDNRAEDENKEPQVGHNELERYLAQREYPCFAPECCAKLMELMNNCWCLHPSERPTFQGIVNELKEIIKKLEPETLHFQGSTGEDEGQYADI